MADNVIIRKNREGQAGRQRRVNRFGPCDAAGGLPNRAEALSADLFDALVRDMCPRQSVTGYELIEAKGLQEQVSTAGRARVRLHYAASEATLPEAVVVKMVIDEPGVDSALYETEVQMYRDVLPGLDIPKVSCLGAAYDGQTDRFVLLLEDLSAQKPFFPTSKDEPLTPERVAGLLSILAKLHARYWNSPELGGMQGWLSNLLAGPQFDFLEAITVPAIEEMISQSPYRKDLVDRTGWTPAQLWDGVKVAHAYHDKVFPRTLVHGDTGAHNTYHLADGTFGFLDWQISACGNWAHDVHYIIVTALSIADRRANERELVAHYLAELKRSGVGDAPDLETAMEGYGRAMIWGFTIGWLLCPERNYGMEIISTNLERLYAAMCDNGTLRLVEQAMQDLKAETPA